MTMGAPLNAPPPPSYPGAMPGMGEPPEASSIRSLLHIARLIALIFGILWFLAGLAWIGLTAAAVAACTPSIVNVCNSVLGAALVFPIIIVLWGVVDVVVYLRIKAISALMDQRQYDRAKSATLVWTILGFILGGILVGIILLIAWLKFDPLINATRGGYAPASPAYYPPTAPMMPQPPAAMPGSAPICPKCQKPGTWIAQYQRYYCYTDGQYL